MNLYEIINKLCSAGKYVVVSDGENYIRFNKNLYGGLDMSTKFKRLDVVKTAPPVCSNIIIQVILDLELEGWHYHSIYTPPVRKYEVGEKVWWDEKTWYVKAHIKRTDIVKLDRETSSGDIELDAVAASAVTPYIPEIHGGEDFVEKVKKRNDKPWPTEQELAEDLVDIVMKRAKDESEEKEIVVAYGKTDTLDRYCLTNKGRVFEKKQTKRWEEIGLPDL